MSSLQELCLFVLGEFADRLDPNIFSGWGGYFYIERIPRHLLVEISKCLNPFDLERLENGQVFVKAGISTESLWKERYICRWNPRPPIRKADYMKTHVPEDIFREECWGCDSWRASYLQRHLQVLLNEQQNVAGDSSWGHLREVHLLPLLNHRAYQRIWSLETTLNNCSRYASYLALTNRACIYLVENPSILLMFAEYIKFLRVNVVVKRGINSVCSLLETLASKNLIGLEFCMCRHVDPQSWSKLFNTRLSDSKCKQLSGLQLSGSQHSSVIGNESFSTTCSYEGFLQATTCKSSSDTGDSPCTSRQMNLQDGGSTFTNQACMSYSQFHASASGQMATQDDRHSSFSTRAQLINHSLGTFMSSNETEPSQCSLDKQDKLEADENLDIHLYDFDADKEMHSDHILSQSKMPEQSVSDLYDEVFASTSVVEGLTCAPVCRSAQCENENAQVLFNTETLPKPYMYAGLTDSSLSCLRHLEYSADDPVANPIPLLLKCLENCHNLESLAVVFSKSFRGHRALFNAICELCLKGKLRHVVLHDLYALPTGIFLKVLCEVVGAYCTICHLDVPASLKSLRLLGSPHISAEVVCHFAKRLTNVCSCVSKEESSAAQVQVHDSAQTSKVHKAVLEQPSASTDVLVFEDSEGGREWFPKGITGSHNSGTSDYHDKDIPTLTERQPRFVQVHAKERLERTTRFTGLQELELSDLLIGDEGAKSIAAALKRNSTLVYLALSSCGINTTGMSMIFSAIAGSRILKTLNLRRNCYSAVADSSLATMLRTSHELSELDMSHCFSHEGLTQEVVFSLCQNNSLKCLKLDGNRLGDHGMDMLSEVFRKPGTVSRIRRLELSSNLISSSSVMTLVAALHSFKPRKLEELILAKNSFGANINKAHACLQSVVDNVYVSNYDKTIALADYVSEM